MGILPYHTPAQEKKYKKSVANAVVLLLGLPTKVLKERYKYTSDQCENVANAIIDKYALVEDEYATLDDLFEILHEEANLELKDIVMKEVKPKTYEDSIFMLVLSIPLIALFDRFSFTPEQCEQFAHDMTSEYMIYKRGYTSIYDLIQIVKKNTGMKLVKAQ